MTPGPIARPQPPRHWVCWALLVLAGLGSVPIQKAIDYESGAAAGFAPVLFVQSGETLRRFSFGYEGLLADIYWTRAVQYFGRQRLAGSNNFQLLGPLLRIATTLDPHLILAYRFGAVFLAGKPPQGAGQPRQALELLRRGIAANPDYWRLWQDVGFIYYWDLEDYASAARAFEAGSERPGALPWMKVLAATVAAKGGETGTSRLLWTEIYRQAENDSMRRGAEEHLAALDAEQQLSELDGLLARYRAERGKAAQNWSELVQARQLRGVPADPGGVPYVIGADGGAHLGPGSRVDLGLAR